MCFIWSTANESINDKKYFPDKRFFKGYNICYTW